jgi:hypothetical protein
MERMQIVVHLIIKVMITMERALDGTLRVHFILSCLSPNMEVRTWVII